MTATTVRANRYASDCADCNNRVEAGEGTVAKHGGRWETRHLGPCPTPAPAEPALSAGVRTNNFPGPCASCGEWVEAKAGSLTRVAGRFEIKHLGECPERKQLPPLGVYRKDGRIYLVRPSRGQAKVDPAIQRRYACVMVEAPAGRVTEGGNDVTYRWEPAKGVVYDLTEADRVPVGDQQVKDMMIKTGHCFVCDKPLYAKATIRKAEKTGQMLGPVCRSYFAAGS